MAQSENSLYDAKRLLAKPFSDPIISEDQKKWAFTVVEGENNRPAYQVTNDKNETRLLYPEEISAKVLAKLKEAAMDRTVGTCIKCIITVPAYFNDK